MRTPPNQLLSLDVLDNGVVPQETGHLNDGRVPQLADKQNDLGPNPEADDLVSNAVSPIMPTPVNVNPTAVEVHELLQGPQALANVIRLILARKGQAIAPSVSPNPAGPFIYGPVIKEYVCHKICRYMKLPKMDSYVKTHFANGGVINNTPLHLIQAHILAKPAKWRDTNLPRGVISNGTLSTEHAQGLNQFLCTMVKHKRTTLRNIIALTHDHKVAPGTNEQPWINRRTVKVRFALLQILAVDHYLRQSRAQVTSQWETIDCHLEMLSTLSPVELQARINLYMRMDAKHFDGLKMIDAIELEGVELPTPDEVAAEVDVLNRTPAA
ncbi:hypothetical protein PTTG_08023 [Puccinia triticina 1-1 BBBD Race 1]|uniref:Uncharacterized protein n=1 Tax=Puccinia triticina (isolate 1-1 / race 1 (BBBD)) TaxID=630390 RepID=A0A0C4F4I3_PUCT1|nr:hypothetical protein PTTG_08023 [Puccinia triticina 1-1 BBBD Race 1]